MLGKTVSHYRIVEKLGEGGMGEVYLAQDTKLNRKIALKFLPAQYAEDPAVLARFKREAQTAAALNHPNIITVHEIGQFEGRPYIAMAFVEGEALSGVIERGDLTVPRTIDIFLQVCDGIESAHRAGVVHRDIKPDNIHIDSDGRVKILDFGLAKLGGVSRLTGVQSTLGTLYYMSPEQVRGEEVDHRSDIFSLGAVLYEMACGHLPFKGEHSAAVIYSITNEDPPPPSHHDRRVPPELDRIVLKALAKTPPQRYQSAAELAEDLERFESGESTAAGTTPARWLKYALPTSVVFAVVILAIILKPFRVEISPDQSAVASAKSIAIMYFENYANREDPGRVGEIVTNLLITDLSESEYIDVLSSQRLYDILKLQGKEGVKVIDRTTASEIAGHAGVKWMLLGGILQQEPSYVLTSQLVDVESGKVVASQRISGQEGEQIFSIVDRLSNEIKDDLALPAGAKTEPDAPVAEVTTTSTDAYRYYLEGREYLNKYYGPEARASFSKALAHDSTFAMVYLHQANPLVSPSRAAQKRAIALAVKYADRVSKREKYYIESADRRFGGDSDRAIKELERLLAEYPKEKEAYKLLGDIYRFDKRDTDKAIASYRKVVEIDPLDKAAYNILAYTYQDIGDIDNYIWAIYQYMSLAPDEANPYDSRADLYAFSGKLDKAIDSYEKALEKKPDFSPSIIKLGHMHVFKQDYETARAYYEKLLAAADPDLRSQGRTLLAVIPLYQGKTSQALGALDKGIAIDKAQRVTGNSYLRKLQMRAGLLAERGDVDAALRAFDDVIAVFRELAPDNPSMGRDFHVYLLCKKGAFGQAENVLAELKKAVEATDKGQMAAYWGAKGVFELEQGRFDEAVVSLETAADDAKWFSYRYLLALAHLKAGRLPMAVTEFEKILRRFSEDRIWNFPFSALAYYHLGVAYEESGHPEKAAEPYQQFIEIWENGDSGREKLEDARKRLARLKVAG